jgi:3-oxoadipate enol-lactonase
MTRVTLHRRVDGPVDAPAVVLLHALGATGAMWEPQVADLAGRYRVIRPDLRGHGGSPVPVAPYTIGELADDVAGLLDDLAVPRAHVVGVSLGGMVAIRLAVDHRDRVGALVLCCTAAELGPAQQWAQRARTAREEGVGALAPTVVSRWLTPGFAAAHPQARDVLTAMVAATPAEGYAATCAAIGAMDQRADLGRITAPTHVIVAADDPSIPPVHGERIAAAVPGARLTVVPDAAHLVCYERPDVVNPLLTAALGA